MPDCNCTPAITSLSAVCDFGFYDFSYFDMTGGLPISNTDYGIKFTGTFTRSGGTELPNGSFTAELSWVNGVGWQMSLKESAGSPEIVDPQSSPGVPTPYVDHCKPNPYPQGEVYEGYYGAYPSAGIDNYSITVSSSIDSSEDCSTSTSTSTSTTGTTPTTPSTSSTTGTTPSTSSTTGTTPTTPSTSSTTGTTPSTSSTPTCSPCYPFVPATPSLPPAVPNLTTVSIPVEYIITTTPSPVLPLTVVVLTTTTSTTSTTSTTTEEPIQTPTIVEPKCNTGCNNLNF